MTTKGNIKSINCPTCSQTVQWIDENKYRPFCSQRCQLIDFGEWATEKNNIPGESFYSPEDDDENNMQ